MIISFCQSSMHTRFSLQLKLQQYYLTQLTRTFEGCILLLFGIKNHVLSRNMKLNCLLHQTNSYGIIVAAKTWVKFTSHSYLCQICILKNRSYPVCLEIPKNLIFVNCHLIWLWFGWRPKRWWWISEEAKVKILACINIFFFFEIT